MPVTLKLKPLSEQVIVITGASSGIGLATAMAAASKGAKLVLAARNEIALEDVCRKIAKEGGTAIYVTADVASREDVEKIAQVARERFGGFDTWVNDAGIGTLGRLEDISEEDHKRLFDTNFWGIVNGSLVAAEHFKNRGGTIINMGSEVSDAAVPLQGMYSASKHAVKGFTNAFRMEIEEAGYPVSVTLIKPAAVATPFFEHAKNYTDHEFKAPGPVYAPQEVARAILHAATHVTRELTVGGAAKVMSGLQAHMPKFYEWLNGKTAANMQAGDATRFSQKNNLHSAGEGGYINGRSEGASRGRASVYTRAKMHPVATTAVVAGIGLAALILFRGGPMKKTLMGALAAVPIFDNHFTRRKMKSMAESGKKYMDSPKANKYIEKIKKLAA